MLWDLGILNAGFRVLGAMGAIGMCVVGAMGDMNSKCCGCWVSKVLCVMGATDVWVLGS